MKKTTFIILLLTGFNSLIAQEKSVVGSGAVSASNTEIKLIGTIGQPITGKAATNNTLGSFGFWSTLLSGLSTSVEIADDSEPLDAFYLGQNYPNPATSSTWVDLGVPRSSDVEIHLVSMTGVKLGIVFQERLITGTYRIKIDVSAFPPGNYIYVLVENKKTMGSRIMHVVH